MNPEETRLRAGIDWAFDAMTSDVVVERSDLNALLSEVDRLRKEADQHRAMAEKMAGALRRVEPYLDAIVCYASTMDEHEPNRIAFEARQALAQEGEG